jgi:hypothetical protein
MSQFNTQGDRLNLLIQSLDVWLLWICFDPANNASVDQVSCLCRRWSAYAKLITIIPGESVIP